MMPDSPLQLAADRLLRLVKKRAEWHLIDSAAAILEDALATSRRGRGRPSTIDEKAIRVAAKSMSVAEMVAAGMGSETAIRRALKPRTDR